MRLVVFDFDGTLSWLRHGWPGIMCEVFAPLFPEAPGESRHALREMLLDEILALNGQPSILQCERLSHLLLARGGPEKIPEEMRGEFQRRLDEAIARRSASITSGEEPPEKYVIHGVLAMLENLSGRGLTLAILSSTIEDRLRAEAELLGIAHFFGPRIHGSTANPSRFTKRAVFERLLREEGLSGNQLLSFGDGPVEIGDTVALGGVAIAICSDEERNGSGEMDERKRRLLRAAGAHAELPDYREAPAMADFLLGQ